MRPGLLVVGVLGAGVFANWAYDPAPPRAAQPVPEVYRGKSFGPDEDFAVWDREKMRTVAFQALDMPWGDRCAGDNRQQFLRTLGRYYAYRQSTTENYLEYFGQAGASYIAQQWATTEDKRIERLTQEAYAKGYLKPDDLNWIARKMMATVVKDERVTGKACAGAG
jgi:hypothetical protein